ncbi:hypothetical protein PCL_06046 [Purpureocillium lilacinum]|uniref:Uncharacterized protein n=1 Tax=Purpureocillium lilacinum TaxID=33203 RepID=A0A2U3ELJ4_PURLI|nr:hypothetical protein PCL_06046 [Purpureocillium lilacinum]
MEGEAREGDEDLLEESGSLLTTTAAAITSSSSSLPPLRSTPPPAPHELAQNAHVTGAPCPDMPAPAPLFLDTRGAGRGPPGVPRVSSGRAAALASCARVRPPESERASADGTGAIQGWDGARRTRER